MIEVWGLQSGPTKKIARTFLQGHAQLYKAKSGQAADDTQNYLVHTERETLEGSKTASAFILTNEVKLDITNCSL